MAKNARPGDVITWTTSLRDCPACRDDEVSRLFGDETSKVIAKVKIKIEAGDPDPVVNPKTAFVDDCVLVEWELTNAVAHGCDNGGLIATTLRVTFTGPNPTTGAATTSSAIPAAGAVDGDTKHRVQMMDPLGEGVYPYDIEILDQAGLVLKTLDPELVKVPQLCGDGLCTGTEDSFDCPADCVAPTIPTVSQWGLMGMGALLLIAGALVLRRRRDPAGV